MATLSSSSTLWPPDSVVTIAPYSTAVQPLESIGCPRAPRCRKWRTSNRRLDRRPRRLQRARAASGCPQKESNDDRTAKRQQLAVRHVVADPTAWRRGKRSGDPGAAARTVERKSPCPLARTSSSTKNAASACCAGTRRQPPIATPSRRGRYGSTTISTSRTLSHAREKTTGLLRVARSDLPFLRRPPAPQSALGMSQQRRTSRRDR